MPMQDTIALPSTAGLEKEAEILVDRWGCALLVVFEKRAHETLDVSFSSQKGFIRSAQCSRNNHFRPRQES